MTSSTHQTFLHLREISGHWVFCKEIFHRLRISHGNFRNFLNLPLMEKSSHRVMTALTRYTSISSNWSLKALVCQVNQIFYTNIPWPTYFKMPSNNQYLHHNFSQENCTLWQAVIEFKYFSNYSRCCTQNIQKRKHTNCFGGHTHPTHVSSNEPCDVLGKEP